MTAYSPTAATIADLAAKNCALYTPAGVKVTAPQQIPLGTFTLRCEPGYRFTATDPTMKMRYSGAQTQYPKFTGITTDRTQASFTPLAATQNVYQDVVATTEEIPVIPADAYVFTQSDIDKVAAANCKMYNGENLAVVGTVFLKTDTFRLVANPTYTITEAYFRDVNSGDMDYFTISGDGAEATYVNLYGLALGGFNVSSQGLPADAYVFTQANLTATTSAQATMYKGETPATAGMVFLKTDQFKLVANEGRLFNDGAVYFRDASSGSIEPFEVASDRKSATYTNLYGATLGGYTVATVAAPVSNHTISQGDLDLFTAGKASLTVNGVAAAVGMQLFPGDLLRTVANAGRVFYQNPNAPDGFISVDMRYVEDGSLDYFEREGDTFTAGDWTVTNYGAWMFNSVQTVAAQPEDVRGFNNVYEITDNQLKLITQSRWVSPPDGGEQIDYGKYMLGLIDLPFKIDPEMIVTEQNVRLGPLDTGIQANYLNSDTIRLNLGQIEVVGTKRNFLDYKNTNAILYLPYSEPINLELEYVIDQTVSVEYLISLYDGTAIVNVSSTKVGEVFFTKNIDLNIKIPFANINTYPAKNNPDSVQLGGDNGVYTAFIEILRNDAVLESGFFTAPVVDEKPLAGYTGFAKVEEINLKSKATSYEKDLIINQLRDGVIIK